MSRSTVLRGSVFGAALVAAVVLGTAVGTAGDEWGCPLERIAHSVYTPAEGGGYPSPDEAVLGLLPELAEDGPRDRDEYASALTSRTGATRYDPDTGMVHVDGKVYARLALTQLGDGTWTIDNMRLCHRPPSELASPGPTPGA